MDQGQLISPSSSHTLFAKCVMAKDSVKKKKWEKGLWAACTLIAVALEQRCRGALCGVEMKH